jgi:hypothetical protein
VGDFLDGEEEFVVDVESGSHIRSISHLMRDAGEWARSARRIQTMKQGESRET